MLKDASDTFSTGSITRPMAVHSRIAKALRGRATFPFTRTHMPLCELAKLLHVQDTDHILQIANLSNLQCKSRV